MTIPLLAPQDVARRLRLSTSRLMQLDREGKLPALRDSAGRRLYDPDVVERFAQERERQQQNKAA
jgi:DNA-binding transcriptional MerR regulator